MKKYLFSILLLLAGFLAADAQTLYDFESDIYGLNEKETIKKTSRALEIGIAKEFEIGFRFQRNFNKYLSWDILGIKYAYDFSEGEVVGDYYSIEVDYRHEFSLTTGIRLFTPKIGQMKFFAALDFGYQQDWQDCYYSYYGDKYGLESRPHFLTEFSIGLQFKKFYLGYGLSKTTGDFRHTDQMVRLGFNF